MKLDKRITDKAYILDCFSVEQAKAYLNEQGYFSDFIENFSDLNSCTYSELSEISNSILPYKKEIGFIANYRFFLPEKFVREEEKKKYRPYTLDEFLKIFNQGDIIRFRYKKDKSKIFSLFLGYIIENGNVFIEIGHGTYNLEDLFDYYEWQNSNTEEYIPFGMEVEE